MHNETSPTLPRYYQVGETNEMDKTKERHHSRRNHAYVGNLFLQLSTAQKNWRIFRAQMEPTAQNSEVQPGRKPL